MIWQRARTDEQKEVRIAEILSAAERLFDSSDYEAITLVAVAKESKFTRSNLYKYFNTKEEIYIELIKRDFALWADDLETVFNTYDEISVGEFADVWVDTFIRHPRLSGLIPILFTTLEKNATLQNLVDFKFALKENIADVIAVLCRLFPSLTMERAVNFLMLQMAAAIGLLPMAHVSEKQKKAMEQTGMEGTRIEFAREYKRAVTYILQGMLDDS
jgi:AcrR family transcriptional regulator